MNEIFERILQNDINYLKTNHLSLFLKDERGKTLIHYACLNESTDVLNYLIEAGLNVNLKDSLGETALFDCARKAKNTFLALLIKAGALVNSINNLGEIALHLASRKGSLDTIKLLLEAGSDILKRSNQYKLPIHYCLVNDNLELFEFMLKNTNLGFDIFDDKRNSLLHYSSSYGSINLTKYLASNQLDVNYLNDFYETPLFNAVRNENIEVVKFLLSQGAFIEIANRRYETVTMIASDKTSPIETILVNFMESTAYQNYLKENILLFSTLNRDFELAKQLVSNNVDPHNPHTKILMVEDKYHKSALDYAKQYGLNSFVALLNGKV
jgi:ankyrin repeat protein